MRLTVASTVAITRQQELCSIADAAQLVLQRQRALSFKLPAYSGVHTLSACHRISMEPAGPGPGSERDQQSAAENNTKNAKRYSTCSLLSRPTLAVPKFGQCLGLFWSCQAVANR